MDTKTRIARRLAGLIACVAALGTVASEPVQHVDLSRSEHHSVTQATPGHVLANAWWQNIEIRGFAGAGFYDTGSNGTYPHGGFGIKEASLFVTADIWDDVELFMELQTNRLGKDDQLFTRTGEVLVHFRDVVADNRRRVGVKVGRFDIPFGEEYLWQDAIDNPLITNSASYVYGWDEGVLIYGDLGPVAFVAALTDGTDERSFEDHDDKALNLKLSGKPADRWYLSFSAMRNGKAGKSAVEFGGSHFEPVGASHLSSVGTSASDQVDGVLFQVDARYDFSGDRGYVSAFAGTARQDDDDGQFDRDFNWFGVEAYRRLSDRWYAVGRYSEIGTYDSEEGYHFDGKIYAGGNAQFGYDTERFRRLGVGAGFQPNPRVTIKFEVGRDWFDLIDTSTARGTGDRSFAAAELAVRF